ncbi:MAG: YkgJ family cysteine cluster protein [Calditrichia bacterium]
MAKNKFYNDGLHFECTGCANCCKISDGFVSLTSEEKYIIMNALNLVEIDFNSLYVEKSESGKTYLKSKPDGACIFLEHDKCTIYDYRPIQCRTFPFWPENLKSAYRWKIIKDECPGIGQGKLYTKNEIDSIVKVQRTTDINRKDSI